jgi:hypothetical protein
MPDDRLFHKRLGHSEKVNKLTDFEDRVWRSYILSADDFGVMRFSAVTLQADHDYLGSRPAKLVLRALERVHELDLVVTFEHQGRTYCAQADWQNHQRVKHPRQTINPKPPPEQLERFSHATRQLFDYWPGKKKETVQEDSGNSSAPVVDLARARPREMANANGYRLAANANGSSPSDELAERAGRFCERYADLYQQHRKGARYIGKPNLDYLEAVELCRVWPDDRLDKIAQVFLTTDHEFAEKGSRTMAQFRAMASWCDSRLVEAGIA